MTKLKVRFKKFFCCQLVSFTCVAGYHIYINKDLYGRVLKAWLWEAGYLELATASALGLVTFALWMFIERKLKNAPPPLEWRRANKK